MVRRAPRKFKQTGPFSLWREAISRMRYTCRSYQKFVCTHL